MLVILRHGDAGDALALPERDALRPLTAKGRKQARRAGKALARLGLAPADAWTSRLRRSVETAEIAAKACGAAARVTATAALSPEAQPERVSKALLETPPPPPQPEAPASPRAKPARGRTRHTVRAAARAVPAARWIVGHEPHCSRLLGYLTGSPPAAFDIKKGAFAVVECDGRGPVAAGCRLVAMVSPDTLRAIRRS
jgi:phosphohistidine phosphatase SixA